MKNHTGFPWTTAKWYKHVLIPILCLFPLLIRFNQCLRRYIDTGDRFPHLANAAKYALSQTVTLFGAFHPLYLEYSSEVRQKSDLFQIFWVVVFVSSSLYSFTWDVFMDWGLGRREYGFLGPSLMYPRRYYYFAVMAIDLGTSRRNCSGYFLSPMQHSTPSLTHILLVSSPSIHVGVDPCASIFWSSL
jgi:EXS family